MSLTRCCPFGHRLYVMLTGTHDASSAYWNAYFVAICLLSAYGVSNTRAGHNLLPMLTQSLLSRCEWSKYR